MALRAPQGMWAGTVNPGLQPYMGPQGGLINPSVRMTNPVGGLVDQFSRLFRRADPPPDLDTNIERLQSALSTGGPDVTQVSTAFQFLMERLTVAQMRKQKYKECDEIEDEFAEVSAALTIYADNVCSTDAYSNDIMSIVTDDERVGALWTVFKDQIHLDAGLWTRARWIAGRGEHFDEVIFDDTGFINRLKPLPCPNMQRNETEFGLLPFESAFSQVNDAFQVEYDFGIWQVAHYRLLRRPDDIYGTGLIEPVRRLAQKVSVAEDALLLTRLVRAPKRTVFGVPTGGMAPDQREKYVADVKRKYRKRQIINPRTQRMDLELHPLAAEEDIFIGYPDKDNKLDITEIGGDPSIGQISDIEWWQNKILIAMMVPKAYLTIERDVNAKATLTEQDVQFARTVHRIQMVLVTAYRQVFDNVLLLCGIDPKSVQYTLTCPAISLIDELRNWEIENLKLQTAQLFADLIRPSDDWMLVEYLGFSMDEAAVLLATQKPEPEPEPAGEGGVDEEFQKARRAEFEELLRRGRTLKSMGERAGRRQTAVAQQRYRQKLAEEMARYRHRGRQMAGVHQRPGSGY